MNFAIRAQATGVGEHEVPLKDLIPTIHYDAPLVARTKDQLESFRALGARLLLMPGAKSPRTSRHPSTPSTPSCRTPSKACSREPDTWPQPTGGSRTQSRDDSKSSSMTQYRRPRARAPQRPAIEPAHPSKKGRVGQGVESGEAEPERLGVGAHADAAG